jgi:hypothetical protein
LGGDLILIGGRRRPGVKHGPYGKKHPRPKRAGDEPPPLRIQQICVGGYFC